MTATLTTPTNTNDTPRIYATRIRATHILRGGSSPVPGRGIAPGAAGREPLSGRPRRWPHLSYAHRPARSAVLARSGTAVADQLGSAAAGSPRSARYTSQL